MSSQLQTTKQEAMANLEQGNIDLAAKQIRQVCNKERNDPEAWFLLGKISANSQKYTSAIKAYSRVIEIGKDNDYVRDALINLGVIYLEKGKYQQSVDCLELVLSPELKIASVYVNLANACLKTEKYSKAKKYALQAVTLSPSAVLAHLAYGSSCAQLKEYDLAEAAFKQAVNIDPDKLDYLINFARKLQKAHAYTSSIRVCRHVLAYQVNYELNVQAWTIILVSKLNSGFVHEGIDEYNRLVDSGKISARNASCLLLAALYSGSVSRDDLLYYHERWGKDCNSVEVVASKFRNRSTGKIRVGYVSPDFRNHSIASFIKPVLQYHNRIQFEIYCFSNVKHTDAMTRELKELSGHWIDVSNMSDLELDEAVDKAKIDILVDLAGHTKGNRLTAFAQRMAPVQISWLGYPQTTGLPEMDYRLVDSETDPEGSDQYCTEELVRIPDCFLCYDHKPVSIVEPSTTDPITFCSFNNLSKITESVVALWAKLLLTVGNSKIIIKSSQLSGREVEEHYLKLFENFGIGQERIELLGYLDDPNEHLRLYDRCDVALDTFPYNGTTTSCEAMWKGVPVVTLCGDAHASRVGSSLLKSIGAEKWIAYSESEFLDVAINLVKDRAHLRKIRLELQDQMKNSLLCDGKKFIIKLENIYKNLYQRNKKSNPQIN